MQALQIQVIEYTCDHDQKDHSSTIARSSPDLVHNSSQSLKFPREFSEWLQLFPLMFAAALRARCVDTISSFVCMAYSFQ